MSAILILRMRTGSFVIAFPVLVLRLPDIDGYSVHKIFCHKAQYADNGYSIDKCCNAVTGYLVIALRVNFSAPLAAFGLLARE